MSISEEGSGVNAGSDSFWEIGQFKRTVKRIDDGPRLFHDLATMIKERGEIESKYAKELRSWARSWNEKIEKGPEYGTIESAWKGVLSEAEERCNLHLATRDRLQGEVNDTIKEWLKQNCQKTALGALKQSKEAEDMFRKAQKPWAKLYAKVEKAKKEFHAASKAERSAQIQASNAEKDQSISQENQKKFNEKVDKCREEKEKCRETYRHCLDEINQSNAKYMEDMTLAFEKCQDIEEKRLKFMKEMLLGVHNCLDLSKDARIAQIYKNYHNTVSMADHSQDLRWWSQNHGTGMAMNWPQYEEYQPELRRITKKQQVVTRSGDPVMLISQKPAEPQRNGTGPMGMMIRSTNGRLSKILRGLSNGTVIKGKLPRRRSTGQIVTSSRGNKNATGDGIEDFIVESDEKGDSNDDYQDLSLPGTPRCYRGTTPAEPNNPYSDDWGDAGDTDGLQDSGEPGVEVRALYDYTGAEDDELNFKKGDVFEKLEEEDEQGWCKGRKGGRVGLYPANYVEMAK